MDPNVLLLYCMFLNKGRVVQGAINARMGLPLTITEDIAERVITDICRSLFRDYGVSESQIKVALTQTDFCHFKKTIDPANTTKYISRKATIPEINIGKFGKTFWRS